MSETDKREFIAIISIEDDPSSDISPGEFLEQEFGWLEQSNIVLENWALVDTDVQWEQYLRYLVQWAISHTDDIGESPMYYRDWLKSQLG